MIQIKLPHLSYSCSSHITVSFYIGYLLYFLNFRLEYLPTIISMNIWEISAFFIFGTFEWNFLLNPLVQNSIVIFIILKFFSVFLYIWEFLRWYNKLGIKGHCRIWLSNVFISSCLKLKKNHCFKYINVSNLAIIFFSILIFFLQNL